MHPQDGLGPRPQEGPPPAGPWQPTGPATPVAGGGPAGPPPANKVWPWAALIIVVAALAIVATITFLGPKTQAGDSASPVDEGGLPAAMRTTRPPSTSSSGSGAAARPSTTHAREAAGEDGAGQNEAGAEPSLATTSTTLLSDYLLEDIKADQLRTPTEPADQGEFRQFSRLGKSPVFNACKSIHYTVHVGAGPSNGLSLIQEAVGRLSAATGLEFVYEGTNDVIPRWAPPSSAVDSLVDAYDPIFIGWATRNETDIWSHESGDILGVASPQPLTFRSGDQLIVSGAVVLLPTKELAPRFGAGATVGNVLLHELGHLVGLDHVSDPDSIMQPELSFQTRSGYGPGDLRGLWQVGASKGCASTWLKRS